MHCGLKTSFKDYFEFKEKEILSKLTKVNNTSDDKKLDDLYNEKTRLGYNLHYAMMKSLIATSLLQIMK